MSHTKRKTKYKSRQITAAQMAARQRNASIRCETATQSILDSEYAAMLVELDFCNQSEETLAFLNHLGIGNVPVMVEVAEKISIPADEYPIAHIASHALACTYEIRCLTMALITAMFKTPWNEEAAYGFPFHVWDELDRRSSKLVNDGHLVSTLLDDGRTIYLINPSVKSEPQREAWRRRIAKTFEPVGIVHIVHQ